ncbi:ABC transporter permease [Methyloglobulus sp.]|uniref:ABC transporter permease n=1 Tax=Methyloglobulus sp. TaxID=2518622 RepID=UPI0039893FBB
MHYLDILLLSYRTITSHKLRSALTVLGMIIGIAAVIILTSVGRGIHNFVIAEFTRFGTNLIGVSPGKKIRLTYWELQSLRDRSRVVPRSDRAGRFHEAFFCVVKMQSIPTSRRVIA